METIINDEYYHIVTGACKTGIKDWKQAHNITVDKVTVKYILPILEKKNAYGFQKLKNLIK